MSLLEAFLMVSAGASLTTATRLITDYVQAHRGGRAAEQSLEAVYEHWRVETDPEQREQLIQEYLSNGASE